MRYTLCFLLFAGIIALNTNSSAQNISAEKTITHTLICNDTELFGRNSTQVDICMNLMKATSRRIQKLYSPSDIAHADTQTAVNVLSIIDSVFSEFGFLDYTDATIHFDFLTLAFKDTFDARRYQYTNMHRWPYWSSINKTTCKLIDCDLYCLVYLGIAEMNSLPLSTAELPHHNFIRWNFPSGQHINWEAIKGTYERTDSTLYGFDKLNVIEASSKNRFLRNWSRNDVLSYYYTLRGIRFANDTPYKNIWKAKKTLKNRSLYLLRGLMASMNIVGCLLYILNLPRSLN